MTTFQATLQNLRKRRYKTIKAFAEAYGCGPSKASGILNGHYHMSLSKDEVKHIASLLGVSFVECADACDNTFAELKGFRGNDWKDPTPRTHKGIWERWRWEEEISKMAYAAARDGDWTEYRKKYGTDSQQQKEQPRTRTYTTYETCFTILGIPPNATPDQIKNAFRAKVKAAHDGKGGFTGDMDKLVQAKEEALKHAR